MDESKALMLKIVRIFATGDLADVESLIAPGYVDHHGLTGEAIVGPKGFRRVVEAARAGYLDLHVQVEDMIAEDEKAAARLSWSRTRRTDTSATSGPEVVRQTIEIVHFRNGQANEHWGVRL